MKIHKSLPQNSSDLKIAVIRVIFTKRSRIHGEKPMANHSTIQIEPDPVIEVYKRDIDVTLVSTFAVTIEESGSQNLP
jgi:hypothetical protein